MNGVSKSNITGYYILSGRASTSSEDTVMDNRTIVCYNTNLEKNVGNVNKSLVQSKLSLLGSSGKSDVLNKRMKTLTNQFLEF